MFKKGFFIVIALVLVFSMAASSVFALSGEAPLCAAAALTRYNYIHSVSSYLDISSNGTAHIYSDLYKTVYADSIYLSASLQRKSGGSWTDVASWSASSSSSYASISETYSVSSGTYRVKTYYSVSGSGGTESGTIYSKIKSY